MSRKVKVRIPLVMDHTGDWCVESESFNGDQPNHDEAIARAEDMLAASTMRCYWITAEIETPSPPSDASEVEGTTEEHEETT